MFFISQMILIYGAVWSTLPLLAYMRSSRIVGREGNNYWVARGGRCRLTAPEHLRPSGPDETGEFLAMNGVKRELEQLFQTDFDDDEAYRGGIEDYSPSVGPAKDEDMAKKDFDNGDVLAKGD